MFKTQLLEAKGRAEEGETRLAAALAAKATLAQYFQTLSENHEQILQLKDQFKVRCKALKTVIHARPLTCGFGDSASVIKPCRR